MAAARAIGFIDVSTRWSGTGIRYWNKGSECSFLTWNSGGKCLICMQPSCGWEQYALHLVLILISVGWSVVQHLVLGGAIAFGTHRRAEATVELYCLSDNFWISPRPSDLSCLYTPIYFTSPFVGCYCLSLIPICPWSQEALFFFHMLMSLQLAPILSLRSTFKVGRLFKLMLHF